MKDLVFQVTGGRVEPYAATPTLMFDLAIEEAGGDPVESISLRCQLRIEPHKRRYGAPEADRLNELFGDTPRWGDTLKPFLWTHVSTVVPGFRGATVHALPVPCSYDLEVAGAKYLHALEGGEIPLLFLFSGTVFTRGPSGVQVHPVPWEKETAYRLPVRTWRDLMDAYFPQSGWLRLRRDTLDELSRFKIRRALATWDDVVRALLQAPQNQSQGQSPDQPQDQPRDRSEDRSGKPS